MTHEINLADFAAFCRSKGKKRYPVCDTYNCALGQYARERFPLSICHGLAYGTGIKVDGKAIEIEGLPPAFVYDSRAIPGKTGSFSALADRLEALAEQSS